MGEFINIIIVIKNHLMVPPFKMVKSTISTKKYFSGFVKTKNQIFLC